MSTVWTFSFILMQYAKTAVDIVINVNDLKFCFNIFNILEYLHAWIELFLETHLIGVMFIDIGSVTIIIILILLLTSVSPSKHK